jgi:hypothetical protein
MISLETLNTKVSVSELSFLLVTHMVLSDEWFDSYVILMSGHGADFFGQTGHTDEFSGLGT